MINLVRDSWIPIKRQSGLCELIAPWQLTETADPVIELNARRPDFNGALMQFLIGLLQTTIPPEDSDSWLKLIDTPPRTEKLKESFSQYAAAFELDSTNGSFMQDFEALNGDPIGIADLLIDSPGGNTIKQNKDHFIKRGQVEHVCVSCATIALFTLQTNAPSGGQGHRTSLRGGGPLTTLVILDENCDAPSSLWQLLWLNVLEKQKLNVLTGDEYKDNLNDIFPWMATTRTSEKKTGNDTTPLDTHPLQMYWGMPRRIKINWQSDKSGNCHICNADTNKLISDYQSKNYGTNYTGAWQHPLSPYSLNKTGELLPIHAQPGGMTYQHWLDFIEDNNKQFSAIVVQRYRKIVDGWDEQFRLYAFGYDMDNMKARCWYESTFPLFALPESIRLDFILWVQLLTKSASEFAGFVRSCVKESWFKRPADAKGDTSFLVQGFYQHTEKEFYQQVKALIEKMPTGSEIEVLNAWYYYLKNTALNLFDYWATRGDFTQANPRRVAQARSKLIGLMNNNKIKKQLLVSK